MKVLLVYPRHPETFWGMKHALRFTEHNVDQPPLGLLTVASMLPIDCEKRLVDMNLETLRDEHLTWADYVFISAMDVQRKSASEVISRANKLGISVVAGGPLFTENHEEFGTVDHLVLGEAEITLPMFLKDLKNGDPKHLYLPGSPDELNDTPAPLYGMLNNSKYHTMSIQYSRGCPFNCEFCCVVKLFGRKVRTKSRGQVIKELDALYNTGWKGHVFFVDDNFIGNKEKLKSEVLPAILEWSKERNYPFDFFTQASLNMSDDEELMHMMSLAGFSAVFVGIETIDDDCLSETGKFQNRNRDMVESVKKIQRSGMEVWSGFIIGFDSDKETIFNRMAGFIQESGIVFAMVGLLTAFKGTRLYGRLQEEGRLINSDEPLDMENQGSIRDIFASDSNNTLNFVPKMDRQLLVKGYEKILRDLYLPHAYYSRIITFLKEYQPAQIERKFTFSDLKDIYPSTKSFIKTVIILGCLDKGRLYYWKLFFWTILNRPRLFARALGLWVEGYHFRKVFGI